ncbi:VOC family protein [Actinokineospora globicatena]|uniref:Glyoxalase n=1 Tax=Actinokineospora globicatena TaxID=103729 RepID=A0A9W6VB10_9PSEU|nr:VOC family protein [Actinokineospora globicatena]MCP2301632.1 Glyoxalase-like domain-containing protein [Actinokineospora globicatena]GLW76713.1 glyoxalase [Actinokineospora globicatena]GLW83546.1 glyoxalase [Actinokineospora globicatena]GLW92508.1 glyoxalase [Actinokineospora globicatena]
MTAAVPRFFAVVLDCPDPIALSGFYADLLGWARDAEPAEDGSWATIEGDGTRLDFQKIDGYQPPTWPHPERQQMLHLDLQVDDLQAGHDRAVDLGATPLERSSTSFWVYADPAGHPFCLVRS